MSTVTEISCTHSDIVLGIRQSLQVLCVDSLMSVNILIPHDTHYCSIGEAVKLITDLFDRDKKGLQEFTDNVVVAFELVHPSKHDILLKFVKTKITGDTRSKVIIRDLTQTWALVKRILEENGAMQCTLDFYAYGMFSVRQKGESVTSWGSRTDEMQTELREASRECVSPRKC